MHETPEPLVADPDVALLLQIDERGQGPKIELNLRLNGPGIDLGARDSLAADMERDAGLRESLDQGDVRVVGAVVRGLPGVVVYHNADRLLMENHGDVPMARGHSILGKRVDVLGDQNQAGERFVGLVGFVGDVENDFVGGVRIGKIVRPRNVRRHGISRNGEGPVLGEYEWGCEQ